MPTVDVQAALGVQTIAPDALSPRRMITRSPRNPMDKSTILSIYPKEIVSVKHTLNPWSWIIPACSEGGLVVVHIGPASWLREIEGSDPPQYLEIVENSAHIAKSIVQDWMQGLFGIEEDAAPGVFYVPGKWEYDFIRKNGKAEQDFGGSQKIAFDTLLDDARRKQKNYWLSLVKKADTMWVNTNNSPAAISEEARLAAQILKLEKTWLKDYQMAELIKCPACFQLINPAQLVCHWCKTIVNRKRYDELGLSTTDAITHLSK